MNPADSVKRAALNAAIDYLLADPEKNLPKAMETVNKYAPAGVFPSQRKAFANAIENETNWYQLILKVAHLNPDMIGGLLKTFVVDANMLAWGKQEKMRTKYGCNIPWAILLDPTSAFNLHCLGCWAADYGHKLNLTFEDIDSIICQGKELGVHVYIYTGGEPLVRKDDVIALCRKHPDCAFLCFTNATLIDEKFCQDMIEVKNFIPAISAEGFEETTDARRGKGTYRRIQHGMELLREHNLPFGVSTCFTRQNASSVCTEEYFDWMIEQGALFCWIFTYMPVGTDAPTDLMASAEQRAELYHHVREMREKKPPVHARLLERRRVRGWLYRRRQALPAHQRPRRRGALRVRPLCQRQHPRREPARRTALTPLHGLPRRAPFDGNYLRPCPILDNPYRLEEMVRKTGAYSTDLVHEESAHELCAKCEKSALEWYPVATQLWSNPDDPRAKKHLAPDVGMSATDMDKFKKLGRDPREEHAPQGAAE